MYFQLGNDCYFIKGITCGVIYNISEERVIALDKHETDIMDAVHNGMTCEEEPFLTELCKQGMGFFSQERYYIDRYRLYNNYMLMRPDLRVPQAECAFLQLTNQCVASAEKCREKFCAPCRCYVDREGSLEVEQWQRIVDMLIAAGFLSFVLTGGIVTAYPGLVQLMDYINQHGAGLHLLVNDHCDLRMLEKDVPVIAYLCSKEINDEFLSGLVEFKYATVLLPDNIAPSMQQRINARFASVQCVRAEKKPIDMSQMNPCGAQNFFKRRDSDSCFCGKMYIDCCGNLIPCFQAPSQVIGNILSEPFPMLYKKLLMNYWHKPIAHEKCKQCEWLYSCPICTFMNPDELCTYDAQIGKWQAQHIKPLAICEK